LAVKKDAPVLKSIGIPNQFCGIYGERKYLQQWCKLDVDSITKNIKEWIEK